MCLKVNSILKKRYNNVWEFWGSVTGSGSSSDTTYTDDEISSGVSDRLNGNAK